MEEDEIEEGEIHPMVSVTKIDPSEIPEVSQSFSYIFYFTEPNL